MLRTGGARAWHADRRLRDPLGDRRRRHGRSVYGLADARLTATGTASDGTAETIGLIMEARRRGDLPVWNPNGKELFDRPYPFGSGTTAPNCDDAGQDVRRAVRGGRLRLCVGTQFSLASGQEIEQERTRISN